MQKQRILPVALLTIMLLIPTNSQVQLIIPEAQEIDRAFSVELNNATFFKSTALINELGSQFRNDEDIELSFFDTDTKRAGAPQTITGPSSDTLSNLGFTPETVAMIRNLTSTDEMFSIRLNYNTFIIQNGTIRNTVLKSNQNHVFQVNLMKGQPYAFSIKISGDSPTETIQVTVIDPNGQSYSEILTLSTSLLDIRTVFPSVSGNYSIIMLPLTGNVMVEQLDIITGITPIPFTGGYTETVNGTASTLKVYSYNSSSTLRLLDVGSLTYIPGELQNYARPADLLGEIRVRVLSPSFGFFGSTVGTSLSFISQSTIYISVEILPPNEADPFIKAEKNRLGLPSGFYAEYSFWVDEKDIPTLPTGPVAIEYPTSTTKNLYTFSSATPFVPSLNGTVNTIQASFYEINTMESFLISEGNIIENHPTSLDILPAGDYLIAISDTSTGPNAFEINFLTPTDLPAEGTISLTFDLYAGKLLRLPNNKLLFEIFNATYLDHFNLSVNFRFSLFNSLGDRVESHTKLFEQYASRTDPLFASDNNTIFGPALNQDMKFHTVGTNWLLITYTGNTVWNSSISLPTPLSTNNESFQATIELSRTDYWETKEAKDPLSFHISGILNTDFSDPLNASVSEIVYRMTYPLVDGGNYLSIRTENHSFSGFILAAMDDQIIQINPTATTINGTTFYSFDFFTPGVSGITYGFVLVFNYTATPQTDDGVLQVNIEQAAANSIDVEFPSIIPIEFKDLSQTNPEISIETSISTSNTSPEGSQEQGLNTTDLLLYGGISLAVVALGGVIFYVVRKRRSKL
ncbi:MAG: hypothetical protein D6732_18685 [Methanobacteriota archaeon]|nr:MAG: hypothetical protein D6732_18685 [Euryarchaeota archaeon]